MILNTHLTCLVVLVSVIIQKASFSAAPKTKCSDLALSINNFGLRISDALSKKDEGKNLLISPFSISVAMAMIAAGANGETSRQIHKALGLSEQQNDANHHPTWEEAKSLLKHFLDDIHKRQKRRNDIEIANGVFLQKKEDYPIKNNYKVDLETYFSATAQEVDFINEGEKVMNQINEWVKEKTHGKIDKMLAETPSSLTKMILMNAMHFKGLWKVPFKTKHTHSGTFHKSSRENKSVEMMRMRNQAFKFYEDFKSGYKFLLMPYEDDVETAMMIVLPLFEENLDSSLMLDMNSTSFCEILGKLNEESLSEVALPKFSMKYSSGDRKLVEALIDDFGVEDVFDSNGANLSGIRDQRDLFVSSIFHEASIDINEEGSEASATTGAHIWLNFPPEKFIVDRPFLFYILDLKQGVILFSGKIFDP